MRENGNEQPIKFKKCLIHLKLVILVTKWAFTVYRRKEVMVEVCTCTCMYKCRHRWSLPLCIIEFGHARWMVNSNICKYSRLSITLTFKGNWKRFELLGVWVIGRSNYREFELSGVWVIGSSEPLTWNKEKTVLNVFLFMQCTF